MNQELKIIVKADGTVQVTKQLDDVSAAADKVDKKTFAGFRNSLAMTGLAIQTVEMGLQSIARVAGYFIKPAADMEQFRLRLVSLYQSTDLASKAFDKFREVAAKTPATLPQVVQAGAALKAFGLDAENTLESVSDLAAYMGMDVVEAASAVGRAFAGGVGAADILRERGVLELIKSFKGIDDLTKLSLPDFRKALIESISDPAAGIAGAADRMSKSFAGSISNMDDAMLQLRARIGDAVNPILAEMARFVSKTINQMLGMDTAYDVTIKKTYEMRTEFERLVITYTRLRNTTNKTDEQNKLYQKTINDLMTKYPNYLKGIDLERDSWEKVKKAISGSRQQLTEYINVQIQKSIFDTVKNEAIEAATAMNDAVAELEQLKASFTSGQKNRYMLFPKVLPGQKDIVVDTAARLRELKLENEIIPELTVKYQDLNAEVMKRMATAQKLFALPPAPEVKEDKSGGVGITSPQAVEAAKANIDHIIKMMAEFGKSEIELVKMKYNALKKEAQIYYGDSEETVSQYKKTLLMLELMEMTESNAIKKKGLDETIKGIEETLAARKKAMLAYKETTQANTQELIDYQVMMYAEEAQKYLEMGLTKIQIDEMVDTYRAGLEDDLHNHKLELWNKEHEFQIGMINSFVNAWASAFTDVLRIQTQSQSIAVKAMTNFVNQMISELMRLIAKQIIAAILAKALLGGASGGGLGFWGLIGSLFTKGTSGGMPSIPAQINNGNTQLLRAINNLSNRIDQQDQIIRVFVDPRDISRAAEFGGLQRVYA